MAGGVNQRERGGTRAALLVPREEEHTRGAGNQAEGIPSTLHPLSERESGRSSGGINREGRCNRPMVSLMVMCPYKFLNWLIGDR